MAKTEICKFCNQTFVTVKVSKILNNFIDDRSLSIEDKIRTTRRYRKTKESIEKFGYDPCKYGHITVRTKNIKPPRPTKEQPYTAFDGNHRVLILMDLYGPDYEVTIKNIDG